MVVINVLILGSAIWDNHNIDSAARRDAVLDSAVTVLPTDQAAHVA